MRAVRERGQVVSGQCRLQEGLGLLTQEDRKEPWKAVGRGEMGPESVFNGSLLE